MEKNIMKDKEYPMSYDAFEKRVTELLLEEHGEGRKEKLLDFVNGLKEDPNDDYLESLYLDSCYRHDRYGGDAFTDYELIHQPVRLLFMLYGD